MLYDNIIYIQHIKLVFTGNFRKKNVLIFLIIKSSNEIFYIFSLIVEMFCLNLINVLIKENTIY